MAGDFSVTHSAGDTSIRSLRSEKPLRFTGGNLTITEASTVTNFTWSAGNLTLPGGLTNLDTTQITGGNNRVLSGVLINAKEVIQTGNAVVLAEGAEIRNQAGALYLMESGSLTYSGGSPDTRSLRNEGTLRKSTGSTVDVLVSFHQIGGKLEILGGALRLRGGGANQGGEYEVAEGTELRYQEGTHRFAGTFNGTGEGRVVFNGAQIVIEEDGATVDFAGNLLHWTANRIDANGSLTNLNQFNITGGNNRTLSGTLINRGLIVHNDNSLFLDTEALISNAVDQVYQMGSGSLTFSGGNASSRVFDNRGVFRKSTGSTIDVHVTFNVTDSKVEVEAGALRIRSLGNYQNAIFEVAAGTNLQFLEGTHNFSGETIGVGEGRVLFNGGLIEFSGEDARLSFPGPMLEWSVNQINALEGVVVTQQLNNIGGNNRTLN